MKETTTSLKFKLKTLKMIEKIYKDYPELRFFENSLLFTFYIPQKLEVYKKSHAEKWSIVSRKGWGDNIHWLITFHLGACGAQLILRKIHIAWY